MTVPHSPEAAARVAAVAVSGHLYMPAFGEPVSDWFRWFAWRPVETVDRGHRWLRPVWRRRIHKHDYLCGGSDFWFQHAVSIRRT